MYRRFQNRRTVRAEFADIRRMKMIKIAVIILGIITISMIACILCTSVIAGKRADESIERYFKEQKRG